ncbi:hypothetical protein Desde_1980 [Desulfitobacterium dehalogenans ATCC 51507]|uniref:Uncharacterized protein n=1 Tax=Desulfitobacterium dehalogenans (strain ATCC 51507 / DSM 9161 / JW/IU-DC1) TaxID=756499 RepID=I4A8T2_DESDJ|nr:hypothetical protein Desde_1980 [Desulfitobacterium dehalogenans ATCC 51507]
MQCWPRCEAYLAPFFSKKLFNKRTSMLMNGMEVSLFNLGRQRILGLDYFELLFNLVDSFLK